MLFGRILVIALATTVPINPVALATTSPINDPIKPLQMQLLELPPFMEPAIAYEPAVRLSPPITAPEPEPIRFTSDSANGRCIGAEGLLSKHNPGWSIERMSRIMYRESRCQPTVRNASGSTGLLQIMPSNCRYIANQLGESCTVAKLQQPEFNIRAATTLFDYDGYGPWKL